MRQQDIGNMIADHAAELMALPPIEPIPRTEQTDRFCPVSLEDWIKLAEKANVPFVPAHLVTEIARWDALYFEDTGPHQDRLGQAFEQVQRLADGESRQMVRFDFCSSSEVKYRLSVGEHQWDHTCAAIILDDPRFIDLLYEFPRERVPIWRRPWIDASIVDNYPVEYRVFVSDGEIKGISSYYPQRPLPRYDHHIEQVTTWTRKLIRTVSPPFLWNNSGWWGEFFRETMDPDSIHFTVDYIVDRHDAIMLLEGGPPHELGAHPCCFAPGEIAGVALSRHELDL